MPGTLEHWQTALPYNFLTALLTEGLKPCALPHWSIQLQRTPFVTLVAIPG